MLDQLTPEEMDERYAHYELSGAGDARLLTGLIAAEVHNTITRYVEAKSERPTGARLLSEHDFVAPAFVPDWIERTEDTGAGMLDPNDPEQAQQIIAGLGFGS